MVIENGILDKVTPQDITLLNQKPRFFWKGIKGIKEFAFADNQGLINITIPRKILSIGTGTFDSCTNLTKVVLPKKLTSIGFRAFDGCSSLKEINLPRNLKTIENSAFESCSSLTTIDIPSSVDTIPAQLL